jgi:hypothetical protein
VAVAVLLLPSSLPVHLLLIGAPVPLHLADSSPVVGALAPLCLTNGSLITDVLAPFLLIGGYLVVGSRGSLVAGAPALPEAVLADARLHPLSVGAATVAPLHTKSACASI